MRWKIMQNQQQGQKQAIRDITCTANQCYYNCPGNKCTAKHINVDRPSAENPTDTLCSTFQLK